MSLPLQLSAVKGVRMEGHALHQNNVVVVLHSQDQPAMKVSDTHTHTHTYVHTRTHSVVYNCVYCVPIVS